MNTLRNKVSLVGHLGKTPELTKFESGSQIVRLSLATHERQKNKDGEWADHTQWHNISAWGKVADRVVKFLDKGMEVMLEGRLVHKSYETKAGEKRMSTEIEMNDFLILSRPVKQ
jgi:single-strand DNA-binding protein